MSRPNVQTPTMLLAHINRTLTYQTISNCLTGSHAVVVSPPQPWHLKEKAPVRMPCRENAVDEIGLVFEDGVKENAAF